MELTQPLCIILHKEYVYFTDYFIIIDNLRPKHTSNDAHEQWSAILKKELRRYLLVMDDKGIYNLFVTHKCYRFLSNSLPTLRAELLSRPRTCTAIRACGIILCLIDISIFLRPAIGILALFNHILDI